MKTRTRLAAASLFAAMLPATAWADLHVCNHSGVATWLSVAERLGSDYGSRGWFVLEPNGPCKTVVEGKLRDRYYYLYGYDKEGSEITGNRRFCIIKERNFNIFGADQNCEGAGREWRDFMAIDTASEPDFTFDIYDDRG